MVYEEDLLDVIKDGNLLNNISQFIYTFAYSDDERSLCGLEMRSLFGIDT